MQVYSSPTRSQNGYGNSTIGFTGFTIANGANYKHLLCGSSKYLATHKIDVVTSKKDVNCNSQKTVNKFTGFYKLNKQKVRKKILAYAGLKESRNFFAFYSISFPQGFPDRYCWQVQNTVLTRLRKLNKNFNYLWVAERQGNGTAHFHMVTNNYFNIKVTNHYYKQAIDTILRSRPDLPIKWDKKKYNGCDVVRIYNVKGASRYITKYVSKQNETWEKLPWNCSNAISRLFTGAHVSQDYIELCKDVVAWVKGQEGILMLSSTFHNICHIHFKSILSNKLMKLLADVNQQIYYNNMPRVNELLNNYHQILSGWFINSHGELMPPKQRNEAIECPVQYGYNQFEFQYDVKAWFN